MKLKQKINPAVHTPSPSMTVPLIRADLPSLDKVESQFREILATGKISNFGKHNTAFEQALEKYLGTHCATTSSGTQALLFALHSAGIKAGDRVLLPSFTFMATAHAILYAGGIPHFVEIADDLNISPSDLETELEKYDDVSAVVGVHMYGLPADVNKLQSIVDKAAKKRGRPISLIYDGAHAFGAKIDKTPVGGFGTAEVFSLSVTKTLVSVEGGIVSSKDGEFIQRVKKMRNYGIQENYNTHYPGMNGKMSEFHAVIGCENLKNIEKVVNQRAENAEYYFQQVEKKTPFQTLRPPRNIVHTYKDFTILVPSQWKHQRDMIMKKLSENGIESRAYFYPPVHEQKFFTKFANRLLPKSSDLSRRVITLPFFTTMSREQMNYVCDVLATIAKDLK